DNYYGSITGIRSYYGGVAVGNWSQSPWKAGTNWENFTGFRTYADLDYKIYSGGDLHTYVNGAGYETMYGMGNQPGGPSYNFKRTRGDATSSTAITNGDQLGVFSFIGQTGTQANSETGGAGAEAVRIEAKVDA